MIKLLHGKREQYKNKIQDHIGRSLSTRQVASVLHAIWSVFDNSGTCQALSVFPQEFWGFCSRPDGIIP